MNNQYNPYSPYLADHVAPRDRGTDILAGLMQMMQAVPQGDGAKSFNPIPDREQVENVIRRILPQQDGVREWAIPNANYIQQYAQKMLPQNMVNNRTY